MTATHLPAKPRRDGLRQRHARDLINQLVI
jgi:hypothetical protein